MEYIRVKTSDGESTQSQIMSERQFKEWISECNIWEKAKSGLSLSFSQVKKSPLLTNKNQQS